MGVCLKFPKGNNDTLITLKKNLQQAHKGDLEGNFRKVRLQADLLQIYFLLRDMWYLEPKHSFSWPEKNDLIALALFKDIYDDPQGLGKLECLAVVVLKV